MPEMMQQIPEVMRAPIFRLTWPAMMKNTTPTRPARGVHVHDVALLQPQAVGHIGGGDVGAVVAHADVQEEHQQAVDDDDPATPKSTTDLRLSLVGFAIRFPLLSVIDFAGTQPGILCGL